LALFHAETYVFSSSNPAPKSRVVSRKILDFQDT